MAFACKFADFADNKQSCGKLHKNCARKVKRHRKFKLYLGLGHKYLYECNWFRRRQTSCMAETCLTLRGKMVILVSKINKDKFVSIFLLLEI